MEVMTGAIVSDGVLLDSVVVLDTVEVAAIEVVAVTTAGAVICAKATNVPEKIKMLTQRKIIRTLL